MSPGAIKDKALALIRFEDMKYAGTQSVPTLRNEEGRQQGMIVVGLIVALVAILFVTAKIVFSLADQKAKTAHEVLDEALRVADRRMYEARAQMKKRRTDPA